MEQEQVKLFIIDDNEHHQKAVVKIISEQFPELVHAGSSPKLADGCAELEPLGVQILLVSTELKSGFSLSFLKNISPQLTVVFMTSANNPMYPNLLLSGLNILLKPFDVHEMVALLDRVLDNIFSNCLTKGVQVLLQNQQSKDKQLVLRNEDEEKVIFLYELCYAEAIVGGSVFHLANQQTFFVPQPLRRFDVMLQKHQFMRCHPYYIVNLLKVLEPNEENHVLKLENTAEVPCDDRKMSTVKGELYDIKRQELLYKMGIN